MEHYHWSECETKVTVKGFVTKCLLNVSRLKDDIEQNCSDLKDCIANMKWQTREYK